MFTRYTREGDGLDPYKRLLSTPWASEAYFYSFFV